MRLEWSTTDVSDRDRMAFWMDVQSRNFYATTPRMVSPGVRFEASLVAHIAGDVGMFHGRADNIARVSRTGADVAETNRDSYWLIVQSGRNPLRFTTRSHGFDVRPLDLIMGSDETVFDIDAGAERVDYKVCVIPKAVLAPLIGDPGRIVRGLQLDGRHGVGAMLSNYVHGLAQTLPHMGEAAAAPMLDHIGRLAAIAAGADPREEPVASAVAAVKLERLRRFIRSRLEDPLLNPARAAAALGISVRQVHSLFEPTGVTFGEYVMGLRLEIALEQIRRLEAGRSITDVAYAWGFSNLSTFYRAFRARYGFVPGDIRPGGAPPLIIPGDR